MNWNELRAEHMGSIKGTYLNTPANGLMNIRTLEHSIAEAHRSREMIGKYRMDFIFNEIPKIKAKVGRSINMHAHMIALIPNFSIGINFFVASLPASSKVLLFEGDFPSLNMPFDLNDVKVEYCKFEEGHDLDLSRVEDHLRTFRPDVLAISHTQWLTGYVCDLEGIGSLCELYDCTFVVDATQSFGAIPIDQQKYKIDVLIASCYKWANAGFGNGFISMNEATLERYPPNTGGFNSYTWEEGKPVFIRNIKCYEPGHHDQDAFNRMYSALELIDKIGIDAIHARNQELTDYLLDRLDDTDQEVIGNFFPDNRSSIISLPREAGLFKHLMSNGIEVSERGNFIRMGLHYYNNEDDIEHLVEVIATF